MYIYVYVCIYICASVADRHAMRSPQQAATEVRQPATSCNRGHYIWPRVPHTNYRALASDLIYLSQKFA